MNKKGIFVTLLAMFSLLTSCGSIGNMDFIEYKKQAAIRQVGTDYNYDGVVIDKGVSKQTGDYFYNKDFNFQSVFNGKTISTDHLKPLQIGPNVVYGDDNGYWYDSFGEKLVITLDDLYDTNIQTQEVYLFAAENSSLYKYLSGKRSTSRKLHIIQGTKFAVNPLKFKCDSAFILREKGDTHFYARNVFLNNNEKFQFDENIFPETYTFTKISDTEYFANNFIIKYGSSNNKTGAELTNNVALGLIKEASEKTGYDVIYDLKFGNSVYKYKYLCGKVDNSAQEYTFYTKEQKFLAYSSFGETKSNVDYYPIDYKLMPDGSGAFLLVKKIENREFKKDNYVIKVYSNGSHSDFSKDTSIFDENQSSYYYFHHGYRSLPIDCQILALTSKIVIILNHSQNMYKIVTNDGVYSEFTNSYKYLGNSFNDKYYFLSSDERLVYFNAKTSNFEAIRLSKIIDLNLGITLNNGYVYFLGSKACTFPSFQRAYFRMARTFGVEKPIVVIESTENGIIYNLSN